MPSTTPACPICPTPRIHHIHERVDRFEALRSLRKEQRIDFWSGLILRAARKSKPKKGMDLDEATRLAWEIQQQVEKELRD